MFQQIPLGNAVNYQDESHTLLRYVAAIKRQARVIIAFTLLSAILAFWYILTAVPLYTASVQIMIDNRQLRAVRDVSTLDSPLADAASISTEIESQVEIFRSDKVGLSVVKQLRLEQDPAFVNPPKSGIGAMLAYVKDFFRIKQKPLSSSEEGFDREFEILKTIRSNMTINRIPRTFLIEVSYSAPDATRAAEIANAYANSYMMEDLSARLEATRSARAWLKQRTDELQKLSLETDAAAQKFKADNNLLEAKGTLISEQQYNEMTSQLSIARAATEQAKARYMHLKNVIDMHQTDSAVTESLSDPIISTLRTKYISLANRMKDLQSGLGLSATHDVIINLTNEMKEISEKLFEELERVAKTYRSDYEVAAAHEAAIADDLNRQRTIAIAANAAQVQLRQIEEKAESYKSLYQTFLQRYQETDQQENFPIAGSHIVSPAFPPLKPDYPRKTLVLAIGLAMGAFLGTGIGMLRESLDRVFRTVEQARDVLGVQVVGMLPLLQGEPTLNDDKQAIIMRYAIDNPFSLFAETLRWARIAVDHALQRKPLKIIGVISLLPNEGKSTFSKNFASSLALQGLRTLLVDADMRNPALSRVLGYDRRQDSQGEVLPISTMLRYEPESGLQILPSISIYPKDDPRIANGLSLKMFESCLNSVGGSATYDYIVLDLPPVGPIATARDMASVIDAFIFVVAWGETSRDAVKSALAKEVAIREKLVGVILNKVQMKMLKDFAHFGEDGYYQGLYESSYRKAE